MLNCRKNGTKGHQICIMYVTIDNILYITVNSTTIHVKRFTRMIMAQLTSIYQAIAQKLIDVFF